LKIKQYLSVGVPTVASDIGENNKFVKHLENGYLCRNDKDFKDAIIDISKMSDERYFALSKSAFENKSEFSMNKYCESFIRIYQRKVF
jgi:glycosyltransferase involved in cell wall biosynthesis